MRRLLASCSVLALRLVGACGTSVRAPVAPAQRPLPDVTLEQCGPAPDAGKVYLEGEVTQRPTLVRPGQTTYPAALRATGRSGRVKFAFVIDPAGAPIASSFHVLFASDPGFVEPSRSTVLGSHFVAGVLDGRPVAVCTAQVVNFSAM